MKIFEIVPGKTHSDYAIVEADKVESFRVTNKDLLMLLEWYSTKRPWWSDPDKFVINIESDDKEICYWIGQFHYVLKHCGKPINYRRK